MAGCEELQPAEEETTGYQQLSSHEQFQSVKNHLFSLNASQYTTYCMATIECKHAILKVPAILDTGSSVSLIPYSHFQGNELESELIKTSVKITGVSPGYSPIVGKINCNVIIGAECKFRNICCYVTSHNNPCLFGNDVLRHKSVLSFNQDNMSSAITINQMVNGEPKSFKIEQFDQNHHNFSCSRVKFSGNSNSRAEWLESNGISFPVRTDAENMKHILEDDIEKISDLLMNYQQIIGSEDNQGLFTQPITIPTNGESKSIPKNHVPQALEKSVTEEIQKMIKQGIIEPCEDPKGFNSPVFAVLKSNGATRVVANFKSTLNRVLINPDPFPMPSMDTIFHKIGNGNKYFASMDLLKGYWQCQIDINDRHKTAFTWEGQCYQYTRLAFGLTSAGAIFSRCVAKALADVETKQNIVTYIDDVLVYGRTLSEFTHALTQLFEALQKHGLKLNPKKCDFINYKAEFLGRIVSEHGYSANPEYIQGLLSLKSPTTKDENMKLIGRLVWIKSFLECRLNERVNTSSYATLMYPIHNLNKGKEPFVWTKEAEKALKKIKEKLTTSPIISFPDFSLPFSLTTDASDRACGAILMQEHPNGKKSIIAAISKTFNKTEQNWSTTEREAFCIKWAILRFDYFLKSRTFTLFTDHRSLIYLDRKSFNNAKLRRWQDELMTYSFTLQYIEGEKNVWADMLSRGPGIPKHKTKDDPTPAGKYYTINGSQLKIYVPSWLIEKLPADRVQLTANPVKITGDTCYAVQSFTDSGKQFNVPQLQEYLHVAKSQSEDHFLSKIIQKLSQENRNHSEWTKILDSNDHRYSIYLKLIQNFQLEPGTNLLLLRKENGQTLMVIPSVLRPKFLHHAHDRMNHAGITRTQQHLSNFWWESKNQDVQSYIDSCLICARRKGNYGRPARWDIGHCRRGTRPFEVIYLDFVYMPPCRGKRFLLTMLDSFSRYFMAIPYAHDRAIDAARGLYQMYLTHREKPVIISTDRGTHFTGEVFVEYCKLMDIKSELHCPWRPQSTGNLERQHRTLKNAIFILCEERSCQWLDILPEVVSNMNAMTNRSTGVSPHYIVTGRHPSLNLPEKDNDTNRNPDPKLYGMRIGRELIRVHKAVAIAAAESDAKMEARLNSVPTKPLNPGDKVLLYRPVSAEAKRNKLPWLEGYTVVKSNNMVIKIRNDDNVTCWVHRTQLRYIPDRPEHLQKKSVPLMIPIPVTTQLPTQIPQPPSGGRSLDIGSSENRRSKIPVLAESAKIRRHSTIPVSKETIQTTNPAVIPRRAEITASSTNRARQNKNPSRPSMDSSLNHINRIRSQRNIVATRRYPERVRRPPAKHKDYVKH